MAVPLGPGDLPSVFECLRGCLSQEQAHQKQAEAALTAFGARPGFCSCLVEIILSKEAHHSARWLAVVHLKNSVAKFWRSRLPGSLTEEEKAHLRPKLLPLLDQEDSQIAVQAAAVLAKVARLDYPKAWPSLFNDLMGRLQASAAAGADGTLSGRRIYLALHHILKELASKRLAADQRAFEAVTGHLLEPLWAQWGADTRVLLAELPAALAGPQNAQQEQQALLVCFERWLLQLKALRRMLLFGFPSDSRTMGRVGAVELVAPVMLNTLRALLQLVPGPAARRTLAHTQAAAMLDRGCLKLSKTLRQLAEIHPWSVLGCGALLAALELCCTQVAAPSGRTTAAAQSMARQSLQFLHSAVKCPAYRGSPAALTMTAGRGREQTQRLKELAAEAAPTLRGFWAPREEAMAELIVTRLFPLTSKDLEMWEDSGEEFHSEVELCSWEDSVRGCGEHLFVALLEANRERLAPLVVDLIRRAQEGTLVGASATSSSAPPTHQQLVLLKAAAYHAAAVGAYELHDVVDFSAWLHASLLAEASDAAPGARPLRRAAIKLLSAWTGKMKREDRPPAYAALVTALSDPDPAIHLAASSALHAMVDDWEFDEAQFSPFVLSAFQVLAARLQAADDLGTQLETFALINLIIDRLGDGVADYAPGLLALLPAVWEGGEGQSLLRIQVLLALQRLVHSLGVASPTAYPVLLPVLRLATDPSQPDELNLLEDGLLLWLVALRHAPGPHPGLLAPLPHLLSAMERSTEHIGVGARLLVSCLLLNGPEVMAAQGQRLAGVIGGYVGNVNERGMLCVLQVMDAVIAAFPAEGPAAMSHGLQALLALLVAGKETGMVAAAGWGVFARLALLNPSALLQLFQAAAQHVALPQDVAPGVADPAHRLFLAALDAWIDKFDSISSPPARKLTALALSALLSAPLPGADLLQRCDGVVAVATAVWFELEGPEAGPEGRGVEYLAAWSAPRDDDLPLAVSLADALGEEARRRAAFEHSPVATMRVGTFCKQQLEAAAGVHGGAALNAALNAVAPELAGQLKLMLDAS